MADNSYGVYVSIRTPSGLLFSSNRESWDEVMTDLEAAFGPDYVGEFQSEVLGEPKVGSTLGQVTQAEAVEAVTESLDASPASSDPAVPQFEKCEECGGLKDKWNPPGISKRTNKPYPGFFGCGNFRNHRR